MTQPKTDAITMPAIRPAYAKRGNIGYNSGVSQGERGHPVRPRKLGHLGCHIRGCKICITITFILSSESSSSSESCTVAGARTSVTSLASPSESWKILVACNHAVIMW